MILILFNSTRASITHAYFQLDPFSFIENFCENIDKPELNCNGKCQLAKVAKSQGNEQKTPIAIIDFKELVLFSSISKPITFQEIEIINKQNQIVYQNLYSFTNSYKSFQPPEL